MDARTGLVIGGATAVVASIAVVTAVAVANTAALADAPGTSVASERVIVPAAGTPSATSRPTATSSPRPQTPTAPVDAENVEAENVEAQNVEAEVVDAPAPVVVESPSTTPDDDGSSAPATEPDGSGHARPTELEPVIAEAKATGDWKAVREWTAAHGWPAGRIDALVDRLERERAAENTQAAVPSAPSNRVEGAGLVGGQPEEQPGVSIPRPPMEAERAPVPPGKPAHAGSNVEHGNGAAHGEKKDQSRNPPDKRG
ncbi:hypothetical protein [Microbacterium sp. E-13]|uniref:hypothetical protein n=1 Tax=Microbacterium sp. E-13 TaxID=3404048 RepID=UPI003CF01D0C